jgi:hypothetical protein
MIEIFCYKEPEREGPVQKAFFGISSVVSLLRSYVNGKRLALLNPENSMPE